MKKLLLILTSILMAQGVFAQCPSLVPQKKMASSYHSSIIIDYTGAVTYWGDNASITTDLVNVTVPTVLATPASYTGTPISVAAGSTSTTIHQLFLHTSTGIYGWGSSENTINAAVPGYQALTTIALPAGYTIDSVSFIEASGGGLCFVTKGGRVFVKKGVGAGGSGRIYGDGSTTLNNVWHQVLTAVATELTGVTRVSMSEDAMMAMTVSGTAYVWGNNTQLGNGSAFANRAFATVVSTVAVGVTATDINILMAVGSANGASQFILGSDGKMYGVGENQDGVLGQNTTTDALTWIAVKDASGVGDLTNIVLIGCNNPFTSGAYCVGALKNDGRYYCWGDNSSEILGSDLYVGGTVLQYNLPRIPPGLSYNNVEIGYFEMGGHTNAAFLANSSKFCYIGHKQRGSMGDGTSSGTTISRYDCINTPDAFICPPLAFTGCPAPSSNDLIASSNHATVVINGQPSVNIWGEAASPAQEGINVTLPVTFHEYNGTPLGVAASAVATTPAANQTQMWVHTTQGIWGWGYSANTLLSNRAASSTVSQLALPSGVIASQVKFIRSSRGGIAIVTTSGTVYVRAGAASACSPLVYGDGSAALDIAGSTAWHQVQTAPATPLTGVTELSFAGTAAMAVTPSGTYVWGVNTYTGGGTAVSSRNRAALVTLPAGVTPRSTEIIQSSTLEAAQFILGNNNRVYCLGRNANGVLGKGIATTTILLDWDSLSLVGIKKLSSNNEFSNGTYSIAGITLLGDVYLWGANDNNRIGFTSTADVISPTIATTIASGDASGVEVGGFHTIILRKSSAQFYFAGQSTGGSRGDGTADGTATNFTLAATVANCANISYNISGKLFNDNNALTNNLADGSVISTLRTSPMYANLLDEGGYVIATTPIVAGAYAFNSFPFGNYVVQISPTSGTIFSLAPTTALPDNWVFSGEQVGIVASVGLDAGIPDGKIAIALSADKTNVNFGVQQLPTPVADTLARLPNPGGILTRNITSGFTGLDTSGTITKIHITGFPTNTTSIKIGATTYTSGTWPGAGVTFTTATSGDIDPIDGAVIAVMPFKVIDNADAESTNAANLTVPFMLTPPIANNITAPRLNSSDTAKAIPQLKASNPSGTAITSYKIESVPLPTEGKLYYCAAAPSACALGSLTLAVTGVNITPAQSASLYFDPVQSFIGTASFIYSATDQNSLVSNIANYIIPVTNNPPVTQNIRTAQIIDTHSASALPDLIGADMDGTVVSYTVSSIPSSALGMLSYCSTGDAPCTGVMINITGTTVMTAAQMNTMKFDPVLGFSGDFTFNYIATDNNGNISNTSTYTIPVVPLGGLGGNYPPVATNIKAQNINNSLGATPIPNLLGTDPDGIVVSYTIGATVPNTVTEGTLYYCNVPGVGCALSAVAPNLVMTPAQVQTLQFDPVSSFIGNTSFTYTVTDNNGTPLTSSPAIYTIPVVNNPPVANPSSVSPILNTITTPTLLPPLSGNDADGTVVSYNITSVPLAADGTLKYCATAPAACTPATLTTISGPLAGLTPDQAKTMNFIPNSSFTGDYIFNFTTVDNNGLVSLPAPVTIPVVAIYPTNVGEPPVAYSFNAAAINSLSTASLPTALTGTDPDGTVVTYTVTSIPVASHGAVTYCVTPGPGCATSPVTAGLVLTPSQAATLVFTPDANFTGIATFNYINTDNSGNTSNTATVTIPVNNNPPVASNINNTAINRSSPAVTLNPLASTDGDGTVVSYKIHTVPTFEQGTLRLCTTPPATGCTDVTPGQVIQPADISKLSFTPNASAQTPVVSFLYSTLDNSGNLSNIAAVNVPLMDAFPLPMDLISFTATKQNINALIAWKIGVEEAGDIYTLEHSPNASNWKTINVQDAKNTSGVNHLYDFLHLNVPSGKNFYRLKVQNISNAVAYSPVRMLNFDGSTAAGVFIQPNPVADKLYLSSSDGSVISNVVIRDLSGRKINEYKSLNSGSFIDMSSLNAGLYIMNVTDNNGKEEIFKVTKSK